MKVASPAVEDRKILAAAGSTMLDCPTSVSTGRPGGQSFRVADVRGWRPAPNQSLQQTAAALRLGSCAQVGGGGPDYWGFEHGHHQVRHMSLRLSRIQRLR